PSPALPLAGRAQCKNVTTVTVFDLQITKPIHCEGRSTRPSDLRPASNLPPVPMLAGAGRSGLSDWQLVRKVRGRQSQRPHFFKSRTVKQRRPRSDRHLEVLGSSECDFLARFDLDRLASRRIAADAGGALAHLEDTEPGYFYPLAFLQVLGDQASEVLKHLLALLLRKLMLIRECVGQLFSGDRLASLWFCHTDSGRYCFQHRSPSFRRVMHRCVNPLWMMRLRS